MYCTVLGRIIRITQDHGVADPRMSSEHFRRRIVLRLSKLLFCCLRVRYPRHHFCFA